MKTIGYLVVDEMWPDIVVIHTKEDSCWKELPAGGILLRPNLEVRIFKKRSDARAAIVRTKKYMEKHRKDIKDHEYTIRAVKFN